MGRRVLAAAGALAIGAVPATGVLLLDSGASAPADAAPATPLPPRELKGRRMRPRPFAVAPGTRVTTRELFTNRVFADDATGVALANQGGAQYPVLTRDGGELYGFTGTPRGRRAPGWIESISAGSIPNTHVTDIGASTRRPRYRPGGSPATRRRR